MLTTSCHLVVQQDDVPKLIDPQGSAIGAFQQVIGITIRMDVDFDAILGTAYWALHNNSPCFSVATVKYRQEELVGQV
jgi:hypothetical protein